MRILLTLGACHFGRGTPEEYIKALGKTATKVMQPGQSLTFDKGKAG